MRFLANGPAIPDELLIARDEGRVIFFCGAGVSCAFAGLPGFFGLARNIIEALGVTADDPARGIIEEAEEIDRRRGISGLISADRVFGFLERSFLQRDIEAAVAKALRPSFPTDLSAHRTMLELARGPDGKVRLVTTNFDLLFEACENSLPYSRPPRLPDPLRYEEFEGIIHLHGHVERNYERAAGDGFVLSSSQFGKAYISDAWATSFIRSVLDKYVVVFVGYTADDPPVHYLLEALNSFSRSLEGIYAFQAGSEGEAESKWRHKGAHPIAYDEADNHKALWDTLAAWATRAKDSDAWYENVIALSRKGPETLLPHERGQVAHVVSTLEGARKFSASDDPPPAEWLCVFDPLIRYSKPDYLHSLGDRGPFYDPFEDYGIDTDPVPPKIDPDDHSAKREVPEGAWDCFSATRIDRQRLRDENFTALRGHWALNISNLPTRLWELSVWIRKVSNQPAAVWWASSQAGIHPHLQDRILFELERTEKDSSHEVRRAWYYIFKAWEKKHNFYHEWYRLKKSIGLDGWTNTAIIELALINRPYLKIEKPYRGGPKPPERRKGILLEDMVNVKIEYPKLDNSVQIPDEFLPTAVREFRKNLEYAIYLEWELGKHGLHHLCSIEPELDFDGESFWRTYGISSSFFFYVNLLKRLIEKDSQTARQEYLGWWTDEEMVFARLRIWASGVQSILSGNEAGHLICNLNNEVFWDRRHQRDLLLVLTKRWNDFSAAVKKRIERRLLRGPARGEEEKRNEYAERRAWLSLDRINWLAANGCRFNFDVNAEGIKLRRLAPKWQPRYADKAALSMEGRGGWVRTDTDFSVLISEPLDTLLSKAAELSGRTDDWLLENDPFAGLAREQPELAFAALENSAKNHDYPEWAWRKFLNPEARRSDNPKFSARIAARLSRLPIRAIAEFIHSASDWLLSSSKVLLSEYPEKFGRLWMRLIAVVRSKPGSSQSSLVRGNKEPDWTNEAINAPVGNLAESLMKDPTKDDLELGKGFPASWIHRVEELLALEGDLRRHALVIFTFNLNWFYAIDPIWTQENLISLLDQEGDDKNALWAGFFWGAKVPHPKLYMHIKPHLLILARQKSLARRRHTEVLSDIFLSGWGSIDEVTGERYVSNAEMRDVLINADDEFRSQTLWHLGRWSSNEEEGGWGTKLVVFLTEVWPRHKKTKTPRISARLCDLAFSSAAKFSKIVDIILPLVTEINQEYSFHYDFMDDENNIVSQYPERTLALLFTILPENAAFWPHGSEAALEQIGIADSSLLKDSQLIELKRRWNAR